MLRPLLSAGAAKVVLEKAHPRVLPRRLRRKNCTARTSNSNITAARAIAYARSGWRSNLPGLPAWYICAHGTKNTLDGPGRTLRRRTCRKTVRADSRAGAYPYQTKCDGFCLDGLQPFLRATVQGACAHRVQGCGPAHRTAGADP